MLTVGTSGEGPKGVDGEGDSLLSVPLWLFIVPCAMSSVRPSPGVCCQRPCLCPEGGAVIVSVLQGRKLSSPRGVAGPQGEEGRGELTLKPVFGPLIYLSLRGWGESGERRG